MTLQLAKLQNLLWWCSCAQTAQFAVSVYARGMQRMHAWLGELPILTTVSPVYLKGQYFPYMLVVAFHHCFQ